MWQTKYAAAIPKNLGLGLNFRPCSEGYFLSGRPLSVQCTLSAKEEKERENSSRFLCSYFQYFIKKKIGTKLEIILKRLLKNLFIVFDIKIVKIPVC